jgi:hypothetical protein
LRTVVRRHFSQLEGEGNGGDEGGRLEHRDRFVAGGRNDDSHSLGDDDPIENLPGAHSQCLSGLFLAFVDGVEARSDDLGKICAFIQTQPDDRRDRRREQVVGAEAEELLAEGHAKAQARVENAYEPPENQLRVDRRPAEEPDVKCGDRPHDRVVRASHDRHQDRQDDADGHGRNRQNERPADCPKDLHREERLPYELPVEVLVRGEAVNAHRGQKGEDRGSQPPAVVRNGYRADELRLLFGLLAAVFGLLGRGFRSSGRVGGSKRFGSLGFRLWGLVVLLGRLVCSVRIHVTPLG